MDVYRILECIVNYNGLSRVYHLDKKEGNFMIPFWNQLKYIDANSYIEAENKFYQENYKKYISITKIGSYYYCYTKPSGRLWFKRD